MTAIESNKQRKRAQRAQYHREFAKRSRSNSTPGGEKPSCTANSLDRYFAFCNSSYRHPGYNEWCATHRGRR